MLYFYFCSAILSFGAIAVMLYAFLYTETVSKLISLYIAKPFAVLMVKLPGIMKPLWIRCLNFPMRQFLRTSNLAKLLSTIKRYPSMKRLQISC